VLIDPGDEVATLLAARAAALAIRHILLTHAHVDHVTGVAAAKRALGVPIYLHATISFSTTARRVGRDVRAEGRAAAADRSLLRAGEVIAFGSYEVRPHHTPGHCPAASACRSAGKASGKELFVGDTLFAGSIGRPTCRAATTNVLIASIRNVLFPFGDDAIVHSGHGPDTTIGRSADQPVSQNRRG
jgi:glyoxylase-like metal-dependent hydrolase (beta-lactamase superfamily II)